MLINDDTVRACHATRDLLRLYEAYRATARAQSAAFAQVRRHLTPSAPGMSPPSRQLARISRREALARHTDAVVAERGEQIERRLYELQELPVLR